MTTKNSGRFSVITPSVAAYTRNTSFFKPTQVGLRDHMNKSEMQKPQESKKKMVKKDSNHDVLEDHLR